MFIIFESWLYSKMPITHALFYHFDPPLLLDTLSSIPQFNPIFLYTQIAPNKVYP